ncbi:MAG: molybdate ABC transporter substrate-binding protein [Fimbriimonadaceae bacterium]|nr:molybdate ABC transporter substrate-binding protein [Fimbriimonadaceae bacterium]
MGWPTRHCFIAVALLGLAACGKPPTTPAASVLVLASASSADAVQEIATRFANERGIEVRVSAGASNMLARQVEAGIHADVFLSASKEWGDLLDSHGWARASIDLLANRLVLVVPKGNPAQIRAPEDLLNTSVRFVALAGERVPAGVYAEQALRAHGLLDRLVAARRLVRGQDVRSALGYVERGEAQAGVLYATDALASERVEAVFTFPDSDHDPIVYPLLLLRDSPVDGSGEAFYRMLQSDFARQVFERHGFAMAAGRRG